MNGNVGQAPLASNPSDVDSHVGMMHSNGIATPYAPYMWGVTTGYIGMNGPFRGSRRVGCCGTMHDCVTDVHRA